MNQQGAVSFLDVLGWKGIWKDDPNSIEKLQGLINEVRKKADEITTALTEVNPRLRGVATEVLSISDTIVLFTPTDARTALTIHAKICSYIIPESIKNKIPIRGATSYGRYTKDGNIMIGPAIDEAASWHESTNWIGVILAPSGQFELRNEYPGEWTEYKKIPFKSKLSGLERCIYWEMEEDEAIDQFKLMSPFVPGIAEKYLNTYEFMKEIENRKKDEGPK
ncbi:MULTISPECIES: hypothetical protein [Bacillus cereus group]|uniref:hypothetical protein n=1 Tax=Bacillus cereus group TaxID=86661 RepID=UPI000BF67889|nr:MULTISPECIES: hypothetical protein [Bacillus cereus group]PEQ97743.1 hypothetical protein CN477_27950 [Bacillus cereus]PFD35002.1 hypothetical protein CN278_17505 [Bacillus thuringiensis]PFK19340.1 hypothetical protein COJ03_23540 [Bacillus cereus]PFN26804.1 hypothetical protein COJ69_01035 [Bacillus cereus]